MEVIMRSEELREEMIDFLKENGIKKGIVAEQTGLSPSNLSSWFSGRLILNAKEINIVENYLKEKKAKFA